MLRFLADQNFDNDILEGWLRRLPGLNLLRVQDIDLVAADDPVILEWAATERRVLLTHDVSTMPDFAYERIGQGRPMPGVLVIRQSLPRAQVIEDLLLLAECSREGEWEGQVVYLPL